jgi:hypothetical protein
MKGLQIKRQFKKRGGSKGGPYFFSKNAIYFWLIFAILFVSTLIFKNETKAADINWIGATGDWEDAANWDSGTVPTSADNVTISSSTPITVFISTIANFSQLTIQNSSLGLIGNIGTGGTISLSGGQLIQMNNVPQTLSGDLIIGPSGDLTHAGADSPTQLYEVNFTAENINIQADGSVSAIGQGYGGGDSVRINGRGPGAGAGSLTAGAGGGGHAGIGGNGNDGATGGISYCNNTNITTYGSGGGSGNGGVRGGWGGGIVRLTANNTFTLNGNMTVEGESMTEPTDAGGGGGGIVITAPTVNGTPQKFTAHGGNSGNLAGGGGGGCILIKYTLSNTLTTSSVEGGTGFQQGNSGSFIAASPNVAPGEPIYFSELSDTSARFNWTLNGSGSFYYLLESSLNGTDFNFVTTTAPASTTGYTFLNLLPNTRYWFRAAAANGVFPTSTYTTSSPVYTLARTPNQLEAVNSSSTTGIGFKVSTSTINNNDLNTKYVVKDRFLDTDYFLQNNGTWGLATTSLSYAELGSGNTTSTIGLMPNTLHSLRIASVNAEGALSPFSTSTSVYTLAPIPSSIATSANGTNKNIDLTWQGDATEFFVENTSNNTNSGWITAKTYSFSNLVCNSNYTFRIKAKNGDSIETNWSPNVSSVLSCGSSGGSGGGSGGGSWINPDLRPPNIKSIKIRDLKSNAVVFEIDAERAAYIQISPSPTFDPNLRWVQFKPVFTYNLTSQNWPTMLYLKFQPLNSKVDSEVFSIAIPYVKNFPPAYLIESIVTAKPKATSKISFTSIPKNPIKYKNKIAFAYQYKPGFTKTQRIKIVQTIEQKKGKVVSQNSSFKNIKPKKTLSASVNQYLKTSFLPGDYIVKVKIYDSKNKLIDTNQFNFKIKK